MTSESILEHFEVLDFTEQVSLMDSMADIVSAKKRAVRNIYVAIFDDSVRFISPTPYQEIFESLSEVLATLTPSEETFFKTRYGFQTGAKKTQKKAANELGVSQPQVSIKEVKALRKLRHPSRSRRLKAFLEGKQT